MVLIWFQDLLNALDGNFTSEVIYNPARGTVNIEEIFEGIHAANAFLVPSDFGIMNRMNNTDSNYPWREIDDTIRAMDINNPQSINGALRNTQTIHLHQLSDYYKSYKSGCLHLLSAHNIHLHRPSLGHFKTIGVRGENIIIKKIRIFILRVSDN